MLPVAATSLHSFSSVLRIRYMSEGSREAILFCVIVNQRLLSLRFQTPFKTKKDVIEVLLMLEVPLTQLTQHPELDDLFWWYCSFVLCCTRSCSEACLFFAMSRFCLGLHPV